jgi:hypothetical protein
MMGTPFIQGGPKRYQHQTKGLRKLIETGGIAALLFEPGLGKTATMWDYLSLLALKAPVTQDDDGNDVQEVRVLVACPLVAVDTWVLQGAIFCSPQVNYWAEALGGSLVERARALASRGGAPMKRVKPARGPARLAALRAEGFDKALYWGARADGRPSSRPLTNTEGPNGLGNAKPRIVLEVLNLDTFARRDRYGSGTMADLMLDAVKRFNPAMVIVDESHKIKGAGSNTSRLMDRIGQRVPRRAILTGTVMPAGPMDVFAQWRFLQPFAFGTKNEDGTIRRATAQSFQERFAVMGGYMGRQVIGFQNIDEMQDIMALNAVVARKKDALDLPPVTPVIVPVNLSKAEQDAYDGMKRNLAAALLNGSLATAQNRLAQMMRLRQITSGHLPDGTGAVHELGSSKVDTIASLVHDTLAGEKRILVFGLFIHELKALETALAREGTEVLTVRGGSDARDRLAIRQRFGSDEPTRMVLVAQIKTLSLAVNELVTASHVIFGSLSQQRDDLIQGIDRLHRIGQKNPVTVWYALAPGTVDEAIKHAHDTRTSLEAAVLQHILGEEDAQRVLGAA